MPTACQQRIFEYWVVDKWEYLRICALFLPFSVHYSLKGPQSFEIRQDHSSHDYCLSPDENPIIKQDAMDASIAESEPDWRKVGLTDQ